MDPNQQGQSNAGAPSAPNSGANTPATGASNPSAGTPAAGTPPPVFSGAGAQVPGASVTPGPTAPATPTATPAGSSARRFFGASKRPGSAASAGQPASGIYSGNPTPGVITSAPAASGAAGGKKLSKGMIVGIIVIAILAVVAVVVGIVASNSSSNKSGDSSNSASAPINMSELKTAYNNLANYIAFGDENTSEKKLSDGKTYTTEELLKVAPGSMFADAALKADAMLDTDSSAERTKYFQDFDQLFQRLPNLANNYDINVDNIYEYYHDFSTVGYISPTSIMSRYKANGLEPTRNYIENAVTTNSNKNAIIEYAGYMREYDLAVLNLVNDIKINQGCDIEPKNPNNCNLSAAVSNDAYKEASANISGGSAYQIRYNYQKAAIKTLLSIHELIYGANEGNAE